VANLFRGACAANRAEGLMHPELVHRGERAWSFGFKARPAIEVDCCRRIGKARGKPVPGVYIQNESNKLRPLAVVAAHNKARFFVLRRTRAAESGERASKTSVLTQIKETEEQDFHC
jgi:hypothetical protein